MKGVTGLSEEIQKVTSTLKATAKIAFQLYAKETLSLVIKLTYQDSGNAAYNWRAAPLGVIIPYTYFKGQKPVGSRGDLRTANNNEGIVARARVVKDNQVFLAASNSLGSGGVTFSNSIGDGKDPYYVRNVFPSDSAAIGLVSGGSGQEQIIERNIKVKLKASKVGKYVKFGAG